jgi:two-component system response regulator MprA
MVATEPRILVVDDEPQVVWVLEFSLQALGYTTYSAHDGMEALDQIDRHHPELMVLDVMMPRMDGWSVLERLADVPAADRPRIVVVSALASAGDRERALLLGASAFVPKPFDMDHLVSVLQELSVADPAGVLASGRVATARDA